MPPRSTRTPRPAPAVHHGDGPADGSTLEVEQLAPSLPVALTELFDFPAEVDRQLDTAASPFHPSADDPARSPRNSPQLPSQFADGTPIALDQTPRDGGRHGPTAAGASLLTFLSSPAPFSSQTASGYAAFASPNPFFTPSDFISSGGIQGFGVPLQNSQRRELSTIPGLFPALGATPPSNMLTDLHSAHFTPPEQTLLDGGNTTDRHSILVNVGLHPPIADGTAIASSATMLDMPAASSFRGTPPTLQPASQPNVRIQTLDAGHIFDIVFTDMPSLAWLRPAWVDHDLNGRLLFRLQPPHLADVLVDLELASSRYITSRHQKLNIARAIYTLILADDTSLPSDIAAWDRYSLTLPPFSNLLTPGAAASRPQAIAPSGTSNNPVSLVSPPPNTAVADMSQPIVLGDSFASTPGGTINLFTPLSSAPPQHRAQAMGRADPIQLFSLAPPPISQQLATLSSSSSSIRTRSISAEVAGHQALAIHDPNPLTNSGEG